MAETVFFVEPTEEEADYAIRIFTPTTELPFAGHPTPGPPTPGWNPAANRAPAAP